MDPLTTRPADHPKLAEHPADVTGCRLPSRCELPALEPPDQDAHEEGEPEDTHASHPFRASTTVVADPSAGTKNEEKEHPGHMTWRCSASGQSRSTESEVGACHWAFRGGYQVKPHFEQTRWALKAVKLSSWLGTGHRQSWACAHAGAGIEQRHSGSPSMPSGSTVIVSTRLLRCPRARSLDRSGWLSHCTTGPTTSPLRATLVLASEAPTFGCPWRLSLLVECRLTTASIQRRVTRACPERTCSCAINRAGAPSA
jgi:hypothetical protein